MRCVVLLAMLASCALGPTQRAQLADTEMAPDFTLASQTGAVVALADGLAAGHVALVFYRGHW